MSKWKCEICGNEFDNFHAQGFDNRIYCPLCYFKKENQKLKLQLKGTTHCFDEEEHDKLKKQVENYKKLGFKYLQDKNNNLEKQQKEFIEYLEDKIDICDGFLDTVKSDLRNTPYRVISSKKTNITIRIKENEIAHKVYKEILQKYKSIIGDDK